MPQPFVRTSGSRALLTSFGLIAVAALTLAAQETTPGRRWSASSAQLSDFEIARDTSVAHGGRVSIRVHAADEPAAFANVSTVLPGPAYAGKRLRLSVFLRAQSLGGIGAQLWARADADGRPSIAFANSQATPFRGTRDWTRLTISLDVPENAARIYLGALSLSAGTLWIDDARIEADGVDAIDVGFESVTEFLPPANVPRTIAVRERPHPLTSRGLANVTAFTSALGYVRFFHPSEQAVRVNWDAFAIRGIREVEAAEGADSLAAALNRWFAPIAPSVRFVRSGAPIPANDPMPPGVTHVVFWRHLGVGAPSGGAPPSPQNIYRSERVVAPLSDVGRFVSMPAAYGAVVSRPLVPNPAVPLLEDLGGGVTMSLPIALYTTDANVPDSLRTPHPMQSTEPATASDRATRLADVALAWSLFEHFYPYFDVVKTDWKAARATALQAAATDSNATAFRATLARLVAALHDGHGNVSRQSQVLLTPDIQLEWAEGRVFVTEIGDSAAAHGVRRGDELLSIDGRPTASVIADESSQISGATPQWIRTRAVRGLLAGDPDAAIALRLRGLDGIARDVRLGRGPSVPINDNATHPAKVATLAPGVMYVDLGRISDGDFTAAIPQLEQARAVIFDMRGYPSHVNTPAIFSHLTDTLIHSAHFEVPIVTMPDFRDVGYFDGAWSVVPAQPRLHARVVFLSGGGAISYAESTLGVVEAYRLGDIVGEPSAGTNGNVNPFLLPGGYAVVWTGMRVVKRDGTPHHGVGVIPTVPVSPTAAGLRAGRDEVLERAIALVAPRALTP